jgi:hypothetical protein
MPVSSLFPICTITSWETRYKNFYYGNLSNNISMLNEISNITSNIKQYLSLHYEETAVDFEDDNDNIVI